MDGATEQIHRAINTSQEAYRPPESSEQETVEFWKARFLEMRDDRDAALRHADFLMEIVSGWGCMAVSFSDRVSSDTERIKDRTSERARSK